MFTIVKTYDKDETNNRCNGIWLFDGEATLLQSSGTTYPSPCECLYIPFYLCIAIADAVTFNDRNVSNPYEMIGYIEIEYCYNNDIILSDGFESVRIMKHDIMDFSKQLWDLI